MDNNRLAKFHDGVRYVENKKIKTTTLDSKNAGIIHAACIVFDIYNQKEIALDILHSSNISKEDAIQNKTISHTDRQKMILLFETEVE